MFKKVVFLNHLSFSPPSHGSVRQNIPTSVGEWKGQILIAGIADSAKGLILIGI